MANPNEWGPILWKIIHTITVRLGNENNHLLQKDELNYYNNFTKQIGYVLPCKLCKKHFYDYAVKRKRVVEYYEIKEYAIDYFLTLHNEINEEKNKILFTKENFSIYFEITPNELNTIIKEFDSLFKLYILHHYISAEAVRDFKVALHRLRSIIHF